MAREKKDKKKRVVRHNRRVTLNPYLLIALEFAKFNHHVMYPLERERDTIKGVCRRCGYTMLIDLISNPERTGVKIFLQGYAMKFPCPHYTGNIWLPSSDTVLTELSMDKDQKKSVVELESDEETQIIYDSIESALLDIDRQRLALEKEELGIDDEDCDEDGEDDDDEDD